MWCFVKIKKVSWCNFNQSKDLISQNFVTIRSVLYRNSSLQGWLFYIFLCRFDHWYPVVFCRFCMNFVKHRYFLMYLIHVAQTLLMFAIYLKCLRTNFSYFSFFYLNYNSISPMNSCVFKAVFTVKFYSLVSAKLANHIS